LESRAASNNRSLESEARHILEEASIAIDMSQRQAEFRALSRKLRERSTVRPQSSPSEVIIRYDRDHSHRDGSCDRL
jgi:plasmid stability protein